MVTHYRISSRITARLGGVTLAVVGVALVCCAVLVAVFDAPRLTLLVVGLAAVAAVAVVGWLWARGPAVVRLGEDGYRVKLVRGAGVRSSRWTEVSEVETEVVAGEPCVVLRLVGGSTTTIPVRVLAGSPEAFLSDLQTRLDRGHGYRRIG